MAETRKNQKAFKSVAAYLDLGLRFAVSILLGVGGGYWLDTKLHTMPLFLIIGMFLGLIAGFLALYRAVYPVSKKGGNSE